MQIQLIRRRRGTSTPTPPAFSPADLTGLKVWLDASTLALTNGAAVTSWPDASGAGSTPTGAAGTEPLFQTAVLNGLPIVRFPPARLMSFAANPMTGAAAGTAVTVQKSVADGGVDNGALLQGFGSHGQQEFQPFGDGTIYHGFGSTTRQMVGNPAATLVAFRVHTVVTGAAVWRYYLDGGAPFYATATNTVGWAAGTPSLSRVGTLYAFDGDAAEIIIYNRALTTAELDQVGAYLAAKWGVAWSPVS
jgi:hypothetical protein